MLSSQYNNFYQDLRSAIPDSRLITDPLRTLAYGTDASFYRLIPKVVIKADTESEVAKIVTAADRHDIAITFRAAGTSLCGQAITDSVLVIAGSNWKDYTILDKGHRIRLQPGIIGSLANGYLRPYGRKIGPDPASINAAMIGGIAANNASGMCCGTSQNSYRTVDSMRLVLHDGILLDTADPDSRKNFCETHPGLIADIDSLAKKIKNNPVLADRIHHKFKIKNTTGYSLNAMVDYEDPIDILLHLMIGSEGTLGFISEIVYNTVVEHPHKASALMIFPNIENACSAAAVLTLAPVAAAEIMDRASLRSVENNKGIPSYIKTLSATATALLVETRAYTTEELRINIDKIIQSLEGIETERPLEFTEIETQYTKLWNIRKGLFPAVGAVRTIGTTVIIEDVAFPIKRLAEATLELQSLFAKYRYDNAIIFGHALAGNLHFVFTQDFSTAEEVERYRRFMDDVCVMVVEKYDGSLKGEHGTGRNMAPYVEMEWGKDAYELMQDIKKIFDPKNLLNPGIIINHNPLAHIENLKPLPKTNPIIDKCTECGFCETSCPSKNLTLTPRQRIVIQREISRLRSTNENAARLQKMEADYIYQGELTCAVDGMCATACPVDINTGELTKALRYLNTRNNRTQIWANRIAENFDRVAGSLRLGLKVGHLAHTLLGSRLMEKVTRTARSISGDRIPLWSRYMPRGVNAPLGNRNLQSSPLQVVYFPSCISRTMGPAKGDPDQDPLPKVTINVLLKAGYEVIYPEKMDRLCCGTPFESKGLTEQGDQKAAELEEALMKAAQDGRLPVLCDTSPCLYRMRQVMNPDLNLYEPVEFIHEFLMDKLIFTQMPRTIAIHNTCSTLKMELKDKFQAVAQACARKVIVPERVSCCGFAGDRGFTHPELNQSALNELRPAVSESCGAGYSNSRTCEIGLSLHSGLYYKSILYLVDECTQSA